MNRKGNFAFTITGFVASLIIISMVAGFFGTMAVQLDNSYGVTSDANQSFSKYDQFAQLKNVSNELNSTASVSTKGLTPSADNDIIGKIFGNVGSVYKTTSKSLTVFTAILSDASEDIVGFSFFSPYLVSFFMILFFLGGVFALYFKWRP